MKAVTISLKSLRIVFCVLTCVSKSWMKAWCFHRHCSPAWDGALEEVNHLLSMLLGAIVEINPLWVRRAIQLNAPTINLSQAHFVGYHCCITHMQEKKKHTHKEQKETGGNVAATCCNVHKAFKSCRYMDMSSTSVLSKSTKSCCWAVTQCTACVPECVQGVAFSISEQGMVWACIAGISYGTTTLITEHWLEAPVRPTQGWLYELIGTSDMHAWLAVWCRKR